MLSKINRKDYALLAVAFLWAVSANLNKELRDYINPLSQIGIQSVIGVLILILFDKGKNVFKVFTLISRLTKEAMLLHARAIIGAICGVGLIYYSYTNLSVAVVTWLRCVPLSIVWGLILLNEKPNFMQIISLILGTIGAIVCASELGTEGKNELYSYLLCILGCVCFSYGMTTVKILSEQLGSKIQSHSSLMLFSLYGLVTGSTISNPTISSAYPIILILTQGVLCAVSTLLFSYGSSETSLSRSSVLQKTESLWAPLIAYFYLGQSVSMMQIIGGMLILSSLLPELATKKS